MDQERYYTINEVAALFGVTRSAVYDWMNAGKLPYLYIGSRRRITQSGLDAFIQSGTPPVRQADEDDQKNLVPGLLVATTICA